MDEKLIKEIIELLEVMADDYEELEIFPNREQHARDLANRLRKERSN
jgi:hypothetical protein